MSTNCARRWSGCAAGAEATAQLVSGSLSDETFARLCRWVHPRKPEPIAQPIAEEICRELYGRTFPRED